MSRTLIIAVATCCGAVAFLWSIVARTPRRETPVVFARSGPVNSAPRFPSAMRLTPSRDLDSLESYVRDNEADFLVWFDLAELRAAGNAAGAAEAWKRVVEKADAVAQEQPQRARAWFCLGWASAKLGDHEMERRAYSHAEPLYAPSMSGPRGDITVLSRLGWIRRGLGDDAGAKEAWALGEKVLADTGTDHLDADGWYNLACFRSLLGKPEGAIDALTQAVNLGYSDADRAAADDDLIPIGHEASFAVLLIKMRGQHRQLWQEPGSVTPSR